MKPVENPPRLLEHPEFGRDWSAAAGEEFASDRLAACGQEIAGQVAALSTGLAGAGVATKAASTGATIAKVTLAVIAVGGMVTAYVALSDSPKDEVQAPPPVEEVVEAPSVVPPIEEARESKPVPRPTKVKRKTAAAKTEQPRLQSSLLPEQLRLFERAQQAARGGDYDGALRLLQRLETEFPGSPIDPETRLAKAEYLVRGKRYREATVEIQKMLLEPPLAGKRATLYQMLGDAWMNRGRCDRAVGAFEKALESGLEPTHEEAVRAAVGKCEAR